MHVQLNISKYVFNDRHYAKKKKNSTAILMFNFCCITTLKTTMETQFYDSLNCIYDCERFLPSIQFQVNSYQNEYTRESLTLEYVNCLMQLTKNFPDQIFPGKRCARQLKLENWEGIEACANSTEGNKLLQKNGELTHSLNPQLISVPTITFRYVSKPITYD